MHRLYILLFFSFVFTNCNNGTDQKSTAISKEEKIKDTDKVAPPAVRNPGDEEWLDNVYRNKKYKFRMAFPKGWELAAGSSEKVLAQALYKENGTVISVSVGELKAKSDETKDIFSVMDEATAKEKFVDVYNTGHQKVIDYKIKKGSLSHLNAYIVETSFTTASSKDGMVYKIKQLIAISGGKTYIVAINMPEQLWNDSNKFIFSIVLESFVFEL
jgi:hypothetical protein